MLSITPLQRRLANAFVFCALVVSLSGVALAQPSLQGEVAATDTRLPTKGSGDGLKLGESAFLHLGLGAEAGYDTNVFYAESNEKSSPVMRVVPFLELTNMGRDGRAPAGAYFDLIASLVYRQYLGDEVELGKDTLRAFMPTAAGTLELSSGQSFSFGITDTYSRIEDAPYAAAGVPMIRDNNTGAVQVRFAPGGGRLQALLRYTNRLDRFVQPPHLKFADSMTHEGMLDGSWRWLPKTAIFVRVTQGWVNYSDATKSDAFPLHAMLGLRGLVTTKTSVSLAVGYMNAFYDAGANTGGVAGSIAGIIELSYRPTITTLLTLGYRHDFEPSIIGNFYYADSAYLGLRQQIGGILNLALSGRFDRRNFKGLSGAMQAQRIDNFVEAVASIDFRIKQWLYAGASYTLVLNDSDFMDPTAMVGVNYTKHQILGRLGISY